MLSRVNHRLIACAALAMLSLAACTSPEERAVREAEERVADGQECQKLGFRPATEAHANCLLKLKELREMRRVRYVYPPYPPPPQFGYRHYW